MKKKLAHPSVDRFQDPRAARGFRPQFYPQADGRAGPPANAADRLDRMRLRFLAIYYELNRGYARLLEARRNADGKAAHRKTLELAALKRIESVLRRRDGLEDEAAPYGIIAEPVLKKGFTVSVQFSCGNRPPPPDKGGGPLYSSAYLTIPLPAGVTLD